MFTVLEVNASAKFAIVESDTQEEATSMAARKAVLEKAAATMPKPGISGNYYAYPVNAAGECTDAVLSGKEPAVRVRVRYPLDSAL
jgi:hypothetical protein